ncbi:MAG: prepilin peptidase [Desulfobaccales bacterium]
MIAYVLAGLTGLALGSFLNVVITRLPAGEQVWAGRSHCPHCRKVLPWHDNIPLFSYLNLRGRCRFCGAPIPRRYPLVELAGGLLTLALWASFPFDSLLIAYVPFSLALLALSAIDLEHRLLPDVITLPGIILGLGLALILPGLSFIPAAAGVLLGGGSLFVVGWVYEKLKGRRGLGGGDVKLMAMIGAFLGIASLPVVLFLSGALGSLAGVVTVAAQGRWRQGQWRSAAIPYGPFLSAGALIYLFAGEWLLGLIYGY